MARTIDEQERAVIKSAMKKICELPWRLSVAELEKEAQQALRDAAAEHTTEEQD